MVRDDVKTRRCVDGRGDSNALSGELPIATHADARAARARIVESVRANASADSDLVATELIVSELVGNALRHGTGRASLSLEWAGVRAILHVRNDGAPFAVPESLPLEPSSESGRGLFLVQTISEELQVECADGGNHVRVVLPVRRAEASD